MKHSARWIRKWWPWLAIVLAAAALVGRSQLQAEQIGEQQARSAVQQHRIEALATANSALTTSLQRAIVESCEQIGNERAKVQRETLHEEIAAAEHPDPALLESLDLAPETLQRLTNEAVDRLEDRLAKVKITDCTEQYQISPGSGDRRRAR